MPTNKHLEKSNSLLLAARENGNLGLWNWDTNQDLLMLSTTFCDILEIPHSKLQKLEDLLDLLSHDDKESFRQVINDALKGNISFSYEAKITTAYEQSKFLTFSGDCLFDSNHKLVGISGVCFNSTGNKAKSIEEALSQNEEFTSKLLEHSPSALLIHTPDGIILYANQSTANLLQAPSQQDIIGQSIHTFTKKENHTTIRERIKSILKTGSAAPKFEQEFICFDGSILTGESVIVPFEWRGQTVVLAVVRDITEQTKYLKSLKSSEENLKELIKNTPLSLAMLDKDMNYVACSSKYLKDWWVKDEEMDMEKIIGLNHYELFEDVREDWKHLHKKCLAGETILKEDDFFIKADGKREWIRWQNTPWRDFDGTIKGVIIFTEFITKRKESEELIKENQAKLSTILENLPGMVYGCNNDPDWTMNFASNGSIELTGYTPEEFLREDDPISFKKITHPDDVDYVWRKIGEAIENQEIFEIQYRIFTKNGNIKFLFERGQGVFDKNGKMLSLEGIILDVSKQKAIEDRLRKSESNLVEAQRVANLGSWEWHADSKELSWSDEYYRICGLEPGKISPSFEHCIEMLHPADRKKAKEVFNQVLESKERCQLDARIIRKDNEIRYVTYRAELITDTKGEPIKMVGSLQDVTDKKKAELDLKESENRNRALLSALPDIIFILNVDGTYLHCQVPDRSILLLTPEELMGKNVKDLFAPEISSQFIRKFQTAHDTNTIQTVEYSLNISGEEMYFEARIVKYKSRQVLSVIRDITKTKKSELEAKESEKRFYKTFHISPVPITISHIETGELLEVNDKFLQLVNMPREEVIGASAIDLGFWAEDEDRTSFIAELGREGRVYGFDGRLRTKDNRIKDVILSAELINIDNKNCILLMIFDISERKQAENALINLTEELTASNHELRQFAYITSHNLRAPVVNIDTLLQFLDKQNLNNPVNTEVLEKIEISVDQLKSTLNDIIQLVAIKESRYEPDEKIFFEDIFEIVTKNLSSQIASSGAEFTFDFQEKYIMLKKPLLESIVQNLISNAIKYKSDKPLRIGVKTYTKGEYICMSVKDNGKGIDLSLHKDRLFGMYQRFHENIEGKGLGLYITKSQIESMGGKIEAESEPNIGSVFNVYFRVHKDQN
ncbi:PAS domain S-box protein [Fulvivirga sp. 29W222]|uniref:histidine kinase n=1 Tax=Fulvivirga marina TaxID=2494733 RepID=A0A937FUR7_9BACT|nr:PAS domain S-box protein [Fulvivirga marina]MBL6445312.1 PAS domain S-box protein [Fulvivirga marina]